MDSGEAAEGGGRWTKTRFSSSSFVTVAFGLFNNGSRCFSGGRSAVPGRGLGYLPAYARTKEGMGAILRGMDSIVNDRASTERVEHKFSLVSHAFYCGYPLREPPDARSVRPSSLKAQRQLVECRDLVRWLLCSPEGNVFSKALSLQIRSGIPVFLATAGTDSPPDVPVQNDTFHKYKISETKTTPDKFYFNIKMSSRLAAPFLSPHCSNPRANPTCYAEHIKH